MITHTHHISYSDYYHNYNYLYCFPCYYFVSLLLLPLSLQSLSIFKIVSLRTRYLYDHLTGESAREGKGRRRRKRGEGERERKRALKRKGRWGKGNTEDRMGTNE